VVLTSAPPRVSAADILDRATGALARLVEPGTVLEVRSRHVLVSTYPDGRREKREEHVREWYDGQQPGALGFRSEDSDGELLYVMFERSDGRPASYFGPAHPGPHAGSVILAPSLEEVTAARRRLPAGDQLRIERDVALAPTATELPGEARNQALVETGRAPSPIGFESSLEVSEGRLPDGREVWIVRSMNPCALWRQVGAPVPIMRPARIDSERRLSRQDYLTLESRSQVVFDDGERLEVEIRLVSTRLLPLETQQNPPYQFQPPPEANILHIDADASQRALAAMLAQLDTRARAASRHAGTHSREGQGGVGNKENKP
jgi:hypothetical protein